jgi:hypothetical protein
MDKEFPTEKDLEQMAYLMALALKDLHCPDCCGPVHAFIETGAQRYQDEWEWACLVQLVHHVRKSSSGRQG